MESHQQTDEEIATRVQKGDREAFGVLIERYEQKLTRYGRKFLSEREDVRDLVQDTFIKAYANIRGFEASRRFSPWIYRIAHNEFVNAIKKRSGKEMISLSLPDFDTLFPHPLAKEEADDQAKRKELKDALDGSLDAIGAKYREPLVLYYYEEMDYQEIADVLQIPVSTVGVRLKRGRDILKAVVVQQPIINHA
jgi:RNA polymerase sigma-70 factor (ECF subfamily)